MAMGALLGSRIEEINRGCESGSLLSLLRAGGGVTAQTRALMEMGASKARDPDGFV